MKIFESFSLIKAIRLLSLLVLVSTVITMLTPSQSDNPYVQKVLNLLNISAGNFAHNRNLDDPSVPRMIQSVSNDDEVKAMIQEVESLFG